MGDDRPITYQESHQTIYRASSLGHCPRQLVLSRQSFDPLPYPPAILTAFAQGNNWEPIMLDHLRKNNWSIKSTVEGQDEINLQILPNITVRGHLDGVGWHVIPHPKVDFGLPDLDYTALPKNKWRSQKLGIEVKALGRDNWKAYADKGLDAFPAYKWQLSIYMLATNLPFVMVVVDKEHSTPDDITYTLKLYTEPPVSKAEIIRQVLSIESHVRSSTLPPCTPDDFFCPFSQYHDASKPEPELVTDQTQIELIRKYSQYGLDIKLLDAERKHLKELILKSFKVAQPYSGGGFTWTIQSVEKKGYEVKPQTVTQLTVKPSKPNL